MTTESIPSRTYTVQSSCFCMRKRKMSIHTHIHTLSKVFNRILCGEKFAINRQSLNFSFFECQISYFIKSHRSPCTSQPKAFGTWPRVHHSTAPSAQSYASRAFQNVSRLGRRIGYAIIYGILYTRSLAFVRRLNVHVCLTSARAMCIQSSERCYLFGDLCLP